MPDPCPCGHPEDIHTDRGCYGEGGTGEEDKPVCPCKRHLERPEPLAPLGDWMSADMKRAADEPEKKQSRIAQIVAEWYAHFTSGAPGDVRSQEGED